MRAARERGRLKKVEVRSSEGCERVGYAGYGSKGSLGILEI